MPQLRFPKRVTEGLPLFLVNGRKDDASYIEIAPGASFTVSYNTSYYIYAIVAVSLPNYRIGGIYGDYYANLEITTDGTTYSVVPLPVTYIGSGEPGAVVYWPINQSIRGWRIRNITSASFIRIVEIIVLTPDDTKPYLPIFHVDTIELIDNGTTNLDFFSNIAAITDGDDNTYATFGFRGGYDKYTLYLKGAVSLPMATVVTPFILIEIDPGGSNLSSIIARDHSYGYFAWGTREPITFHSAPFGAEYGFPNAINNNPQQLWSQKAARDSTNNGVIHESAITPTYDGEAWLLDCLPAHSIMTNKQLYAPYFFTLHLRPVFIHGLPKLTYYATNTPIEPFVYTAANSFGTKIYLRFGLRIRCLAPTTGNFFIKVYGMGFLCFPQMDIEVPLSLPADVVWYDHVPLGSVTRDALETTESPDITTDEKFVSIYPVAVDVSSQTIRYRIRSTSGGTSTFNIDRYYGFHRTSDNTILWYYKRDSYSVGDTLQSFDITGPDQNGQTKVIKVEITPT
jgi:hypothetical protein